MLASTIGCTLCGTDRGGVTLATAAAQGDLKNVPRNRDVPGGRDSDFREEDWFCSLMWARFVAQRAFGSCSMYNVGASLAYYHIRTFPRPAGKPFAESFFSSSSVFFSFNLLHICRLKSRIQKTIFRMPLEILNVRCARKTCRWNVTCRRLLRSRMTEVKGGSLLSTGDTYLGIQPVIFATWLIPMRWYVFILDTRIQILKIV